MGTLVGMIVFIILAFVFQAMLNRTGTKEFSRYDEKNSDVYYQNADEFIAKLRSAADLGVTGVEYNEGNVNVQCNNEIYDIKLNDGVAFVEYDKSGLGVKVSTIGKIFRLAKFSKLTKKAVCINAVMDRISGKVDTPAEKKYSKIKICNIGMIASTALAVVFVVLFGVSIVNQQSSAAIDKVKNLEYYAGYTYGDVIEGYIEDADWSVFADEKNTAVVEVNGKGEEGEKLQIQFTGDYSIGLDSIESQEFTLYYLGVDGEGVIPEEMMMYMYETVYLKDYAETSKSEQTDSSKNDSAEDETETDEVAEDVTEDVAEDSSENNSDAATQTEENVVSESDEPVIEEENIFVFYNYAGDSMIALAEYNTPASDGAIGEVVQSYNDEVIYSAKYYLDTSGTSCWADDYEVLYYFYSEQDFIMYLGINPSEEGAIMDYNDEYRNNDIYYEIIE